MSNDIAIDETNPRYWSYDGEPTLLLGGSIEDNLYQVDDVQRHLDDLVEAGGNYARCTMSARDEGNVQPFDRTNGTYDLEAWNDAYWTTFERFLEATETRDVVVQIELWDCWDGVGDSWDRSVWNPANNRTYDAAESGLPTTHEGYEKRFENPFLRTVPALDDNETVLAHQTAFVDRILDATAEYEHVLYSIDNETDGDPEWGEFWATFVRERAPDAFVTQMWNPWELRHPEHNHTIDHPETYDFVDVSQNNFQTGEEHWSALQACRARVTDPARPMTNVKIYGCDDAAGGDVGIFGGTRHGLERFWRNVIGGCASARFHRPTSGLGLGEEARTAIEGARTITDELHLPDCEPRDDLLVGRRHNVGSEAHPDREHEAHVLANPGTAYAVYFPRGGEATLEPDVSGLTCRWFDAGAAEWGARTPAGDGHLSAPGDGQWVAHVR